MLVYDSRDRQGNVWLPLNVTINCLTISSAAKSSGKTKLVQYVIAAKNLPYVRKFSQYVNFTDFTVTYIYSENLICENLLVYNN